MATSTTVVSRLCYMLSTCLLINIWPLRSQNCYPRNTCNAGYMDKTNGNMNYWACGKDCPGKAYYTDNGCGCACIPEASCVPTTSPTTYAPTASTSSPTTAAPTTSAPTSSPTTPVPTSSPTPSPTAPPATLQCYDRGVCDFGYMDKTEGDGQYWQCGTGCEGKSQYTDGFCSCACIEAPASCPAAESETILSSFSRGNTLIFVIIAVGAFVFCVIFCTVCRSSQRQQRNNMIGAVGAGLPSKNWSSPGTPEEAVAMQPMPLQQPNIIPQQQIIVPQQQPRVVFVTANQIPQMQQPQQVPYATPFSAADAYSVAVPLQTPQYETEAPPSYDEVTQEINGQNEGEITHA